ncbi:MAG TPA: hypothetical protein V6D48_21630 [Oculatellaceae cyanobacterium]
MKRWSGNKAQEVKTVDGQEKEIMDKNLSPIHLGEILLEDFMKPLGLTQYRLARDLRVTPIYVYDPEGNRLEFWSGRAKV